jgi:hypothetical protein
LTEGDEKGFGYDSGQSGTEAHRWTQFGMYSNVFRILRTRAPIVRYCHSRRSKPDVDLSRRGPRSSGRNVDRNA